MVLRRLVLVVAASALVIAGHDAGVGAAKPLWERVVIRRDTFGVPHILAETLEAAAFGLGYAQAEDHLALLGRRVLEARGEAARVFGPDALDGDLAARRVANLTEARRELANVDRGFRDALEAFAAGVNRYVDRHRIDAPTWMPVVTGADFLAASRGDAIERAFATWIVRELREKYPERGEPTTGTGSEASRFASGGEAASVSRVAVRALAGESSHQTGGESNALALSGRKTVSGRTILLGNPHLSWSSHYWEAHLTVPGALNFYGSTLVGIPWLRAGFNERLGYVQTNNAPDYMDVYALPLDGARPDHYRFDGRLRPLARREISVEVKQADGVLKVERRTFWNSHLGPIVHRTNDRAFALRSAGLESWRHFEGFYRLSRARSLRQYLEVHERGLFYMSNFTYADGDGNVHYLWNTRLPQRNPRTTEYPLDLPPDPALVWTRVHPVRDLPQLVNPPGGYVQNANNSPWFTSRRDPLDPQRFPPAVEKGDLGLRPQIALQMLEAREKFSVDDVLALKHETRMLLADRVKPALLAAIGARDAPSDELRRAREVLSAWDNRTSVTSRGAVLFQRFWEQYVREVRQPYAEPWSQERPYDTPSGLADPGVALRFLEDAIRWTRATYGTEDVPWGEVHRFRLGGLDLPADGAPGALGLYRVMRFEPAADGTRVAGEIPGSDALVGSGDAWVLLVHFTQPLQAFSVLSYGQSSRPGSPHRSNQLRLFAGHAVRPIWFSEPEIAAHLERHYRPN